MLGWTVSVRLQKQSCYWSHRRAQVREDGHRSGFHLKCWFLRQTLRQREKEMGKGGERSLHGGDVKWRFSCTEENISPFLSLSLKHTQSVCLPPTVGIPRHLCDRVSLSEECFVRSQGAPHIRGIRLAPVRWAHSVGREDVRRAGEHRLTARLAAYGSLFMQGIHSPGTDGKLYPSSFWRENKSCSEGVHAIRRSGTNNYFIISLSIMLKVIYDLVIDNKSHIPWKKTPKPKVHRLIFKIILDFSTLWLSTRWFPTEDVNLKNKVTTMYFNWKKKNLNNLKQLNALVFGKHYSADTVSNK